ncbi:hypothetical protein F7725_013514 [Dissostichus mawsoni]|uniref:Uncharacterized protein n=1 Tax=Dissostichus mawsoni TaxID=36200 RepID=A0A7J5Y4X9_DISMA|nr:hypothetical protein F7725_013514 [Dissostichus mawsoni]
MELESTLPISPISFLTAPLPLNVKVSEFNSNLVVQNSIKIWGQFRKHMNLKSICSFSLIMSNHLFAPSRLDMAFAVWHRSGLVYFQDLFSDESFVSFTHLLGLLRLNTFQEYPCPPSKDLAHSVLNVNPFNKGAVSKIYTLILNNCPPTWDKTKKACEGDIGDSISEEAWENIVSRIHTSSFCIRHGLIQFKCRPKLSQVSLFPCLPGAYVLVMSVIKQFLGFWFSSLHKNAVAYASLHARRLILLNWKGKNPPSYIHWIREVMLGLDLEKLRYAVRGLVNKYDKTWSLFITHVRGLSLT